LRVDPDNRNARLDDYIVQLLDAEADAVSGGRSAWSRMERVLSAQHKMLESGREDAFLETALTSEELRAADAALARRRFELARRWFSDVIRLAGARAAAHP